MCRPGTNIRDCLVEQRGEVGKECNIGLRSEEMRRGVKKNHNTTAGILNSIFPAAL